MTLDFHYDAGHAWLEVPKSELIKYGIDGDISECSYQRNDFAFLEEDCDAPKYLDELKHAGIKFIFDEVDDGDSSQIREYQRYGKLIN